MKTFDRVMRLFWVPLVALSAISLIMYVPKQGMSVIAVVIVSFFLGSASTVGYLRIRGRQVRIPIIDRTRVTFSLLVITMLTLSLVSIFRVQDVINQSDDRYRQSEDCNRQFRSALTYNAQINREDNDLRDERDAQLSKRRDAQDELIRTLGPDGVANAQALTKYQVVVASVENRLRAIDARRMEAQRTRSPYPAPTCGTQ